MNTNKTLIGLLAVQVILGVFMWSGRTTQVFEERALFDVRLEDIQEFTIRRPKGEQKDENDSLRVLKVGDEWQLPDYDDYVVDSGKVEDILGRLIMAKIRRAVARKKENHNALGVGERDFTKHIAIKTPERSYSLFAGNAKGTSMHARFDGQDEVYLARGVAAWKISHELRNFIDTKFVNIDDVIELNVQNQQGQVNARQNEDGTWVVAQLSSETPLDVARIRSVVNASRQITMAQPAGKIMKPEYGLGEQARARVSLKSRSQTIEFEVGAQEGEYAFVSASNQAFVAKVRKFNVSSIIKLIPDDFIDKTQLTEASPPNGFPLDPKDWPKDPPSQK